MINFTVIIPTHNRDNYLKIAVESAKTQMYKPLEIIIIDDVPNKSTEKLVKEMSLNTDIEIIYIKNLIKGGSYPSRNLGAKYAKGNYLAWLDDDDYWANNYFKLAAEAIKQGNEIVLSKIIKFNSDNQFKNYKTPPDIYNLKDYYIESLGLIGSNNIYSKDKFWQLNGFDEHLLGAADKDMYMRLKKIGCKHYVIKENVVFYRVHAENWSADYKKILKQVILFYKKYFFQMDFISHLRMIKKIIRFYLMGKQIIQKKK